MSNLLSAGKSPRFYHSYLVRLWQDDNELSWRAVAQSVQTGEISHFVDLASLFTFLQAQTVRSSQAEHSEPVE